MGFNACAPDLYAASLLACKGARMRLSPLVKLVGWQISIQ
jgi:hypothetical protein